MGNQFSVTLDEENWNTLRTFAVDDEKRPGGLGRLLLIQRIELLRRGWKRKDSRMFARFKMISSLTDEELHEVDDLLIRLYAKYKRCSLVPDGIKEFGDVYDLGTHG